MKPKILFIPVNFNSYDKLHIFLESCKKAFKEVKDCCELKIAVADNSTIHENICFDDEVSISFDVYKNDNIGYLGGALAIINSIENISDYKYIIISNVDLELDINFFSKLLAQPYPNNVGWIAPSIISLKEKRDKNPKIVKRYTKSKLQILRLLYTFPFLHKLYNKTFYKRKKLRPKYESKQIYAGHGSIMIFKGSAFQKLLPLKYSVFLFGEECFLAEKLREVGLSTYYDPSIVVIDQEHASTGEMKSKFYYKCNKEAISYIISEFYE